MQIEAEGTNSSPNAFQELRTIDSHHSKLHSMSPTHALDIKQADPKKSNVFLNQRVNDGNEPKLGESVRVASATLIVHRANLAAGTPSSVVHLFLYRGDQRISRPRFDLSILGRVVVAIVREPSH